MTETLLTLTRGESSLSVTLEKVPDRWGVERLMYVVATTSGYRAELPACGHDDGRTPCGGGRGHYPAGAKVRDRREHDRKHCHEWHLSGRVEVFAVDVLKTYPLKRKGK